MTKKKSLEKFQKIPSWSKSFKGELLRISQRYPNLGSPQVIVKLNQPTHSAHRRCRLKYVSPTPSKLRANRGGFLAFLVKYIVS